MKFSKEGLKKQIFKKPFLLRLALMLIGVTVMGICVSVLKLTHLGTDPCSATNYGISNLTGLSFGNVQVIVAIVLLIVVAFFDISRLGIGTIGNMLIVGYVADFTTYFTSKVLGIEVIESLAARIIVMLIFVFIFVIAAALYMNSGLGSSAYDALPYIIRDKLSLLFKKEVSFKAVRIGFDAFFTVLGFLLKGETGVITVLMVITLGPIIVYMAGLLDRIFKLDREVK